MAVDRAIFSLLNKGVKLEIEEGKLTEDTRRTIAILVTNQLSDTDNNMPEPLRDISPPSHNRWATRIVRSSTPINGGL